MPVKAARVSRQICGSGWIPALSSRAASRVPFSAARQAAMTTSCRSPGTTISRPSSRTRTPPGMPWANTATSLIRRDRSPSCRISGFSSRTMSATRGQVSSGRCGTAAISWSWCRPARSAGAAGLAGTAVAGRGLARTSEATGRAAGRGPRSRPRAPYRPRCIRLAAMANCSARPSTPSGSAGQLPTSRTSASRARASAWLRALAYSLDGPALEPLDHDDIGPVVDRRPGRDDLLQDDVEPALAQLPLQFGGAERFRRPQRADRRHQRGRTVGGFGVAVGPGLGHRLDVVHVDPAAVERAQQAEAGPG